MRVVPTILVAFIVVLSAATALAPGADAADAEDPFHMSGYICDLADVKNDPLEGVEVRAYDSNLRPVGGAVITNAEGKFEIPYSDSIQYLEFILQGYTIRTFDSSILSKVESVNTTMDYTNILELDRTEAKNRYNATVKADPNATEFLITDTVDGGAPIAMALTVGDVVGIVNTAGGDALEGATVYVESSNGTRYYATTNAQGYFAITDCLYGDYTLHASCRGFESAEPIEVSTGGPFVTISLEPKAKWLLFGLDTPQAMEVMGIALMGAIVAVVLLAYYLTRDKDTGVRFINDLDEIDEPEDESTFRHP